MSSGRSSQRHRSFRTSKARWYLKVGQYRHLKRLLHGSTRELRRSLFRRTPELRDCLHEAINQRNFGLLKFLVDYCEAHIEARDKDGLTPLYNAVAFDWVGGAMFLLRRGASVHNAERSLSNAACQWEPFVECVVASGSRILFKKVIRRGADINLLTFDGRNCLNFMERISRNFRLYIQKEMKKANPGLKESCQDAQPTQQTGKPRGVYTRNESILVEGLLANQHSQDPRIEMQLLGAWHVTKGDYASAFDCWKNLCQPHESDVDGGMTLALESLWAELLHVDDRRLLEQGNLSKDNQLNYDAFALLVIARFSLVDEKLMFPISRLLDRLCASGKLAICLNVMKHLTAGRVLHESINGCLLRRLNAILSELTVESEFPISVLPDSVTIASRCLSFLRMEGSFSTDRGLTSRHDLPSKSSGCNVCTILMFSSRSILTAMHKVYQQGASASEEERQSVFSHANDFVCMLPRNEGKNIFHLVVGHTSSYNASFIKTLVTLSAETRGTNRQENSPPHLSSDDDGNTPLHVFARTLSVRALMEEGVLQCFLDHGAHLCTRNSRGESVQDILVRRGLFTEGELLPSLQCLAAAAFMKDANLREKVDDCRPEKVRRILLDH